MKTEERKQKIDEILSAIRENPVLFNGISPSMWIEVENNPANPEWLKICQKAVDLSLIHI